MLQPIIKPHTCSVQRGAGFYRKIDLLTPVKRANTDNTIGFSLASDKRLDIDSPLSDVYGDGKERPWREHKQQSVSLAGTFARKGNPNKSDRVRHCGDILDFQECPHGHERHLHRASFCRARLCPVCQWRRSLLLFSQLTKVMSQAQQESLTFVFLTLTSRNVSEEALGETLDSYFKAWKNFAKRKEFKLAFKGWFRGLEVTYSRTRADFHPHFHVLLAVNSSYFKNKEYLRTETIAEMWRSCLGLDYMPVVDVRTVKARRQGQTLEAAAAEVGKYSVKPTDYLFAEDLFLQDRVVDVLDKALKGRRLAAYGLRLRQIHKELNLSDIEDAELVHVEGEEEASQVCNSCGSELIEQIYKWHFGLSNYYREGINYGNGHDVRE